MSSCGSSSSSALGVAVWILLAMASPDVRADGRIVILPLTNLSGRAVVLDALREELEIAIAVRGGNVVSRADVEAFLDRNRVRYTGGVSPELGAAAAEELGATALLVTTVEGHTARPRFTLGARLVLASAEPRILWASAVARSGDEAPGWFEQGIVTDEAVLRQRVLTDLALQLVAFLRSGVPAPRCDTDWRFGPRVQFSATERLASRPLRIAILPFASLTPARNAGDLIALEFVRVLHATPGFEVMEPGVLREQLLRFRVTLEGGLALDNARLVSELLDVDLIVAGTVGRLDESGDTVAAQFTAFALDRHDNQVVWQTTATNRGDDHVYFFGVGRKSSAHALSCAMIAAAVEQVQRASPPAKAVTAPAP